MSAGLASDIVIKVFPREADYVLSFHRAFDDQPYEVPLLHWKARVDSLRETLPAELDDLRRLIGVVELTLDDAKTRRAARMLERLSYGMLDQLLEGSGRLASEVMPRLQEFLAPVFLPRASEKKTIVEIEAANADDLAWRLPFEFFPLAPSLEQCLTGRDELERFLGFQAEIVRSLRGGPTRIALDEHGRIPVHLFAQVGEDFRALPTR